MKKQIFLLIGAVLVLAALAAGIFLLNAPEKAEPESASEPQPAENVSVELHRGEAEDLESLTVQNENGGYSIRSTEDGFAADLPESEGNIIAENTEVTESCVRTSAVLKTVKTISESPDDLAAFGLSPAAASGEFRYKDGSSVTIFIGRAAPDHSGFYGMVDGDPAVYVFSGSISQLLMKSQLEFISPVILEPQEAGTKYDRAVLAGSLRPEPIVLESEEHADNGNRKSNVHCVTSPKKRSTKMEPFMPENGLIAHSVAAVVTSDDRLEEFGLAEPYSTLEFEMLGEHYLLSASKPEGGAVYMMRSGLPLVYRVAAESLPWLEAKLNDVALELIVIPNIDEVDTVRVSSPVTSKEYVFHMTGAAKELKIDFGGKGLETDSFRKYYESLLSIPADIQYSTPLPENTPEQIMQIVYTFRDSSRPDVVLDFYKDPENERRSVILKDGELDSSVSVDYLDMLLEQSEKIAASAQ